MSNFVGNYVEEIRDCIVSASASRLHTQLIGPPGCGKTAISNAIAKTIYGESGYVMTRFDPTTPVSKVEGVLDFAALLGDKTEWRLITDKTPYDPNVRMWIADEVYRANSAVLDKLLDVLDRWDDNRANAPVVIGTANFMPKNERAEAVLDRFGLTKWVDPNGSLSARDIVSAQLGSLGGDLTVPGTLPTLDELKAVWNSKPTEKAIDAVANSVVEIEKMVNDGLKNSDGTLKRTFARTTAINPRRRTYWSHLLYRTSVLYGQTADFDTVHPKALEAMKYAWTCKSSEEYRDWVELMSAFVDPVATAIESALHDAYNAMRHHPSGMTKIQIAMEFGKIITSALDNIEAFTGGRDDVRYTTSRTALENQLTEYMQEAN